MTIDLDAYMDGTSPLEGGPAVPAPAAPTFPKTCNCCGRSYSREEWRDLELCGFSGDEETTLEYRQCQGPVGGPGAVAPGAVAPGCGNTLIIEHPRRRIAG